MNSQFSLAGLAVALILVAAAACAGCGPSSPTAAPNPESQATDQKKVQDLAKKGYDFSEIRSIMKREGPKPRTKKKSTGARR
jgi:hypothetical protein